jgi:hypothetical protein
MDKHTSRRNEHPPVSSRLLEFSSEAREGKEGITSSKPKHPRASLKSPQIPPASLKLPEFARDSNYEETEL